MASHRVVLVMTAVFAALLALLLPTGTTAAVALPVDESRPGIASPSTLAVVSVAQHIAAGQQLKRAPTRLKLAVGDPSPADTTAGQYNFDYVAQEVAPNARTAGVQASSAGLLHAPAPVDASRVAAETTPRLSLDRIRITNGGTDAVERHLNRFVDPGGSLGSAEAGMLSRLRKISAGDISPSAQDLRFYSHELRESVLYRQSGYPTGQPLGADDSYALWDQLHTAALKDYGFPRAIAPDFLYHPSVLG